MDYVVFFQDGGLPATGLSPYLETYINVSDGLSAGDEPTVSELSGGFYKFSDTPAEPIICSVYADSLTMDERDQHIALIISPEDTYVDIALSTIDQHIADGVPTRFTAVSSFITAGTEESGTYETTQSEDEEHWVIENSASGTIVDVYFDVENARPSQLIIRGHIETSVGSYYDVYAYNYSSLEYDKLTTSETRLEGRNVDALYVFTLSPYHRALPTSDNEVCINIENVSLDTGDHLYVDYMAIVGEPGATLLEVAAAIKEEIDVAGELVAYNTATGSDVSTAESNIEAAIGVIDDEIETISTDIDTITGDLGTVQTNIRDDISALNDVSITDLRDQADAALAGYDAPTKAELDTAISTLESALRGTDDDTLKTLSDQIDAITGSGGGDLTEVVRSLNIIKMLLKRM